MSTRPSSTVFAGVPALQQAEPFAIAHEKIGDAVQQGGAFGDGGVRPVALVEGGAGGRDREVGVLLVALRDHREGAAVRGVEDLSGRAGDGFQPLSARVDRPVVALFRLFRPVGHDRCRLPFLFSPPASPMGLSRRRRPHAPNLSLHAQCLAESALHH